MSDLRRAVDKLLKSAAPALRPTAAEADLAADMPTTDLHWPATGSRLHFFRIVHSYPWDDDVVSRNRARFPDLYRSL